MSAAAAADCEPLSPLRVQDLVALGTRNSKLFREPGPPLDRVVSILLALVVQLFDPVPLLG